MGNSLSKPPGALDLVRVRQPDGAAVPTLASDFADSRAVRALIKDAKAAGALCPRDGDPGHEAASCALLHRRRGPERAGNAAARPFRLEFACGAVALCFLGHNCRSGGDAEFSSYIPEPWFVLFWDR